MIRVLTSIAPDSSGKPRVKTWRTGTLTYTKVGLAFLFFWLLWGDFAWSMKERAMGHSGVMQLLMGRFHPSDTFLGLVLGTLPPALSLIVVPIVCYKSDRHRGSWGRRIPFLVAATPFTVVSMLCLAFSPQMGEMVNRALGKYSPGLETSALGCIALWWLVFELAALTITALFNGLVNDVVPAQVLGRFYGLFRAMSLIVGMIFNLWVLAKAETYYVWIFIGVGMLYGIGFTTMCLKVREGEYPASVPMDRGRDTTGFLHGARIYFQECFSSSYYNLYFLTMGLSWLIQTPSIFNILYAKSVHMSLGAFGECLTVTYFCSLILAYPLGALVDRFHPLRIGIFAQMLYALALLMGGLFARDAFTFGLVLVVTGVLSGAWMTATASLGQRLLPKAEFAQFFSAAGMVQYSLMALGGPVAGLFLDFVVHHEYRFIFYMSFGIAVAALLCNLALHRRFMKLGGPRNYIAPEFGGVKVAS
jgi:MFS family permease